MFFAVAIYRELGWLSTISVQCPWFILVQNVLCQLDHTRCLFRQKNTEYLDFKVFLDHFS